MFGDTLKASATSSTVNPPKKTHFKDPALALVNVRQPLQRHIDSNELLDLLRRQHHGCVDGNKSGAASALLPQPLPRMVDQHVSHHLRGDGEEMSPVLPRDVGAGQKPEKRLLHQRGRLHLVVRSLPAEVTPGQAIQFRTDERQQTIERRTVAPAPAREQPRDIACMGLHAVPRLQLIGRG